MRNANFMISHKIGAFICSEHAAAAVCENAEKVINLTNSSISAKVFKCLSFYYNKIALGNNTNLFGNENDNW